MSSAGYRTRYGGSLRVKLTRYQQVHEFDRPCRWMVQFWLPGRGVEEG
jgi:hypothetical protein